VEFVRREDISSVEIPLIGERSSRRGDAKVAVLPTGSWALRLGGDRRRTITVKVRGNWWPVPADWRRPRSIRRVGAGVASEEYRFVPPGMFGSTQARMIA